VGCSDYNPDHAASTYRNPDGTTTFVHRYEDGPIRTYTRDAAGDVISQEVIDAPANRQPV